MKKLIVISIFIILFFILLMKLLIFKPNINGTLFSWNMVNISEEERENLLAIIKKYQINTIYQDFSSDYLKNGDGEFLDSMQKMKIEIWHLAGEPSWGVSSGITKIVAEIDKVINYNKRNKNKISGILLDIEPYASEIIIDEEFNEKHLSVYVENMKTAYLHAKKNNLKMGLAIPFWYDQKSITLLEELIKEGTDVISVMNYRINHTIKDIENEILLAQKHNKKIETIYEIDFQSDGYFNSYKEIKKDYKRLSNHYKYRDLYIAYHHYTKMM